MKEKRPLVWLSAAPPDFKAQETILRKWQLIHVAIPGAPPVDKPHHRVQVGVFDLSTLSGQQLPLLNSWLETLPVERWIAVLHPWQIENTDACQLINRYCTDYHTLPIQPDMLHGTLGHLWGMSELQAKAFHGTPHSYHDFALEGDSLAIRQTRSLLRKFANTEEPVLIYGENGTGKEEAAKYIHNISPRRRKPLVVINCAALPPSLTQNELFGHEKGSFTHALSARKGKIEAANNGTLLLVGIDEFKLEQQTAILRFLQEGQIERIGGSHPINVDARLIVTSTRSLAPQVAEGHFRSDVFYRLGSLHVPLPPLRERKEDIVPLVNQMLSVTATSVGAKRLADTTIIRLAEHHWPGNLRELQNRLHQALLLGEGPVIKPGDMGFHDLNRGQQLSLDAFRSQADRRAICVSLTLARNNVSAAARLLNISRASLYRLMDKHQIPNGTSDSPPISD